MKTYSHPTQYDLHFAALVLFIAIIQFDLQDFIAEFGSFVQALSLLYLATAIICGIITFFVTKSHNKYYRRALGMALFTAAIIPWMNGAVGLIGNEGNPANVVYYIVLSFGYIGSLIARFHPESMTNVLSFVSGGQALIAVGVPIFTILQGFPVDGAIKIFIMNGSLTLLFITSAYLFQKSTNMQS